jgi:hypothetical protein
MEPAPMLFATSYRFAKPLQDPECAAANALYGVSRDGVADYVICGGHVDAVDFTAVDVAAIPRIRGGTGA